MDACIKLHQLNHEINLTWHNHCPEISGCQVASLSNQNHLRRKSFGMDLSLGIIACRAALPTDTTVTNIRIRTWVSLTAVSMRVWMHNSIPHETIHVIIDPHHNMSVNGTTINWSIHQTNKWFGYGFLLKEMSDNVEKCIPHMLVFIILPPLKSICDIWNWNSNIGIKLG